MNRLLFVTLLIVVLAACDRTQEDPPINRGEERLVQAHLENVSVTTRSNFMESGTFFWTVGETMSVYKSSGNFRTYTLSTGAGTNSATFQGGNVDAEYSTLCAVLPQGNHSVSGQTLSFDAPAEYTYPYDTDNFFLIEGGAVNSSHVAMLAKVNDASPEELHFKFMGGAFCFRISNIPAGSCKFVFNANSKISGNFPADISAELPIIETGEAMTDEEKQIIIRFTASAEICTRVFYIPMPTGTYTGFGYEIYNGEEVLQAKFASTATNTVNRGSLIKFPTISCDKIDTSSNAPGFNQSDI